MQKIKLKNGLTVIYQKKETNSVAIEFLVKVGSNNETKSERGISHFLEHMVFEGTKKRPTSQEIANEIEKIGGDLNAYTSSERTCFFVKVLNKHFDIGLDVLTDILQNPLFSEKGIEKEKKIVIKEIDMVNDEPRFYQWILFEKNIFDLHPAKFPTYGDKKVIQQLTRKKVLDYYNKYYNPNNIVLSIVGNIPNWRKKVEQKFTRSAQKTITLPSTKEPLSKKNKIKKEKRKITNTYFVLGYKTISRKHPDSYTLDVISGILGRGQSGWMFQEIRSKLGLAYEVGTQHACDGDYGYFAIYLSTDRKKVPIAKKAVLKKLNDLNNLSEKELNESKTYLEGNYLLETEDNQKLADALVFWEQVEKAEQITQYIKKIKKVSTKDIKRVIKKYFKNYCLAIVEGS